MTINRKQEKQPRIPTLRRFLTQHHFQEFISIHIICMYTGLSSTIQQLKQYDTVPAYNVLFFNCQHKRHTYFSDIFQPWMLVERRLQRTLNRRHQTVSPTNKHLSVGRSYCQLLLKHRYFQTCSVFTTCSACVLH